MKNTLTNINIHRVMSFIQADYQFQELFNKRHYPKETKARVLPFYVINNSIYFLLCEETTKHEHIQGTYNILGGYRESTESIIECAKRELKEESLNTVLFDTNLLKKELILKKNKRYIIFLPIIQGIGQIIPQFEQHKALLKEKKDGLSHLFNNKVTSHDCLCEIKSLKWINEKEIRSRKMYRSVQDIFKTIITPQNVEISFDYYMGYLKHLYKKELGLSPNSVGLNETLFRSNSMTNNGFSNLYITSNTYIIRNSKQIVRQEYLTTTAQSYST